MAKRFTKERRNEILASHHSHGTSLRDTAEREGVSLNTLSNWMRRRRPKGEDKSCGSSAFIKLTHPLTELSTSAEVSPGLSTRYLEITTSYGALIKVPL